MFHRNLGLAILALVCAHAPSHVPVCGQTVSDPRDLPPFQSAPRLVGKVVDDHGKAVAEADVYLLAKPDGAFILPVKPLSTRSAADGEFVFAQVKIGEYQIWAETAQATSLVNKLRGRPVRIVDADTLENSSASKPQPPQPAAEQSLVIPLHAGCGFDIRVLDPHGAPLAGADISFAWTDIDRHYLTESDGIARIRNLAQDEWFVVARAQGFAAAWFKTSKQNLGSILPLEFQLKPGGKLEFKFIDDTGNPIPNVEIFVNSTRGAMTPNITQTETDAQGHALSDNLPLDEPVRVYARKDGFERLSHEATVYSGDQKKITELTLKRKAYGGDLRIRVVDPQGNSIANAEVINRGNSSDDVRRARTNAQGVALLQDLQKSYAGTVVVTKAPGFIPDEAQAVPGTIEQPGNLDVVLHPGNTLRGRITNPEGKPMPKLRVYYDRGENGDLKGGRVDTDDDGRFELTGLGPEVIFTVYTPREYAPIQQLVLRTDLNELMELTLVPTGLLRVRAVDSTTQQPIPAFNVRIGFCESLQPGDLTPKSFASSLMEEGVNIQGDAREYRLDNQVAGTAFKVIVSADGYQTATIDRMVTVQADQAKCIDVPLVPENMRDYQVVAGRLLDAQGKPIVGAAIRLLNGRAIPHQKDQVAGLPGQPTGGWRFYHWDLLKRDDIENRDQCEQLLHAVSDRNGEFRFEKVKRGTPWLELYYTGEGILSQRFSNLRDKQDAELLELSLKAEKPCKLTVSIVPGAYPTAAKINLSAEDFTSGINALKLAYSYEYRERAETNIFDNLPAGTYQISLMTQNRPVGDGGFTSSTVTSKTITLEPGQSLDVRFD